MRKNLLRRSMTGALVFAALHWHVAAQATDGLLACYSFTGNANDGSGNGNNGTAVNGARLTTDRFGNANSAYFFDGLDDYLRLPSTNLQNNNYTYSLWVNAASLPAVGEADFPLSIGGPGGDQTLALANQYGNATNRGWAGGSYNANGTSDNYSVGSLPTVNTWYHLALTRSNSTLRFYVNGQLAGSVPTSGLPATYTGSAAFLGGRYSLSQFFNGSIDDVSLYNRELSAEEVQALYRHFTCEPAPVDLKKGLLACYPFSDDAKDASGNGLDGTVKGAVLTADRFGNANSAYQFDGLDDHIQLPSGKFGSNQYSYSLWANARVLPAQGETSRMLSVGGPGGDQDVSLSNGYVAISNGWDGAGYNTDRTVTNYSVGSLPALNRWYHLVVTRDNSSIKLYVDGKLAGSASTRGLGPYYGSGLVQAIIGGRSTLTQFFNGKIDDVCLYNRAISAEEVAELYRAPNPGPKACTATGTILWEYWTNVPGRETRRVPTNTPPEGSDQLTLFRSSSNLADNYAARIRGYVCAPQTGAYTFWIASDDHSELYLSTDENPAHKVRIAYLKNAVAPQQWNRYRSQQSAPVHLMAGKKYYIEALHKEAWLNDHLAVGWRLPDATLERPIPGARLSPFVTAGSDLSSFVPDNEPVASPAPINRLSAQPNPFTSQTSIDIVPQSTGRAVVELLDWRGKRIKSLFDGRVEAGVAQRVEVDGKTLQNGLYLVRMVNGDEVSQLKLMLQQ